MLDVEVLLTGELIVRLGGGIHHLLDCLVGQPMAGEHLTDMFVIPVSKRAS